MEHQGLVRTAAEKTKHQVALIAIPASRGETAMTEKQEIIIHTPTLT